MNKSKLAESASELSTRIPRSADTRASDERSFDWKPAPLLPEPDPSLHPGLEFRYVRAMARGEADNVNLSQALREKWVPVKAEEYQELHVLSDHRSPFPDGVMIGGLLLCSRPKAIGDQVRAYAAKESLAQIHAVERQYMDENDRRMRKFAERETEIRDFGN